MPANTPRGYPYPLPAEPVAEGAQAIRNLAEGVDNLVGLHRIGDQLLSTDGLLAFSAIPQTFKHLALIAYLRGTAAAFTVAAALRLNGDVGANYTWGQMGSDDAAQANQSSPGTVQMRVGTVPAASAGANNFGALFVLIPNYTATRMHSVIASSFGAGDKQFVRVGGGLYVGVGALTAIQLFAEAGTTFLAGSRATLYGLG